MPMSARTLLGPFVKFVLIGSIQGGLSTGIILLIITIGWTYLGINPLDKYSLSTLVHLLILLTVWVVPAFFTHVRAFNKLNRKAPCNYLTALLFFAIAWMLHFPFSIVIVVLKYGTIDAFDSVAMSGLLAQFLFSVLYVPILAYFFKQKQHLPRSSSDVLDEHWEQ